MTTAAYDRFVSANHLDEIIARALHHGDEAIREAFQKAPIPPEIAREILIAYERLGSGPVAVRSSATAEDLPQAAFAGQQDTFLNVVGSAALDAARRCWASLWTERAIVYRERQRIDQHAVKLAVVVQIGCTVFSYVPASNCGFSEYIAVSKETRRGGPGGRLFEARRGVLDELAIFRGHTGCDGLFIEADNPHRIPADFRERERATAIDADERLRIFAHLGFKRVDAVYVQPPLGYEKQAVSYMDLLFAPWRSEVDSIDATRVLLTVEPIWRAWSRDTCAAELNALRARLARPMVALKTLLSQPERR